MDQLTCYSWQDSVACYTEWVWAVTLKTEQTVCLHCTNSEAVSRRPQSLFTSIVFICEEHLIHYNEEVQQRYWLLFIYYKNLGWPVIQSYREMQVCTCTFESRHFKQGAPPALNEKGSQEMDLLTLWKLLNVKCYTLCLLSNRLHRSLLLALDMERQLSFYAFPVEMFTVSWPPTLLGAWTLYTRNWLQLGFQSTVSDRAVILLKKINFPMFLKDD